RKLVPEVRLALSKLDLKMKGMPSLPVISLSWPATSSCSCIDSITQGPAIRKNGLSRPTSKSQSFICIPPCRSDASRDLSAIGENRDLRRSYNGVAHALT